MGVGDAAPGILPPHLVAQLFHVADEFLFAAAAFHTVIHRTDDLHLPTLALGGGTILSCVHAVRFLLCLFQNRETVRFAEFIRKISQSLQCTFLLPEHPPGLIADGVN